MDSRPHATLIHAYRVSISGIILVARTTSRATVSQPWDENGEIENCVGWAFWTNEQIHTGIVMQQKFGRSLLTVSLM